MDKSWFEMGLEELGLTLKEFNKLSKEEKKEIKEYLRECGHY